MALKPVTDPELLKQLGEPKGNLLPVSDPELLKQLNSAPSEDPGTLKSAALGAMSGVPFAETALSGIQALSPDTTYEEAHKSLENAKDAAWNNHPVAYGAGKTAGLVGTALVAPEGLVGAAATGAGYGLDTSKNTGDMIKDAAIGAGTGSLLHGVGEHVVSPLLEKAGESLTPMVQRGLASLGKDTSIEDIQSYLQNPNAINAAGSKEEIANKLANLTGDIGKASSHLSSIARNELEPTTSPILSFPEGQYALSDNLKQIFKDAASKYLTNGIPATAADETALKALESQYSKLAQIAETNGGKIPEDTLRQVIDRIQSATKESVYGNPEASASQGAVRDVGGRLNDVLRQSNPEYAEKMAPAAEAASLSKGLQKGFNIEEGAPTDATATKLNNVLKEGKPDEMDLATQLKNMTGTDIAEQLKNAQTKENFNASGPGGALKLLMTGLGFGAGHMTHIPGGGIGGAAIARYAAEGIDGGHIAKSILDTYMKGANSAAMKTYGPILVNAAKQGGNSLAATHFVLATSHPEYQKLVEEAQGQPQE